MATSKKKILIVFGTRPEAIKLAPLIIELQKESSFEILTASTGQHKEMLIPILNLFKIKPHFEMNIMTHGQTLSDVNAKSIVGIDKIIKEQSVDAVIVQGDTTTAMAAGLACFYNQKKLIHIEAGLRSHDIHSPFPEELNRKIISLVSTLHFCPTEHAKNNLIKENIAAEQIFVTGNTGIDALLTTKDLISKDNQFESKINSRFSFLNPNRKLILVTLHRRENLEIHFKEILLALKEFSAKYEVDILLPAHMNPKVRTLIQENLSEASIWEKENKKSTVNKIWLTEPLDYPEFIYLMQKSYFILSDSGGIQEEAPAFGKPVLVARENTERPEAIEAGTNKLVSLKKVQLIQDIEEVFTNSTIYNKMSQAKNPYGDGTACTLIRKILLQNLTF